MDWAYATAPLTIFARQAGEIAHPLGLFHRSDHVLDILTSAHGPEGILHSEAVGIHEINAAHEPSFRLLPNNRRVTDPLRPGARHP